ncbi:aldehyde dehydrogenase (NADP(+)) [Terriglobus aquaticus]|uniref:Aldehyde dehydrogenase (NADP(+)) n=1 Tax=Terriglobus aquaticus TaxID=940139 RepID=A0ABW9KGN0_9BACT|nr:aldehyde dehydrogenase (NADP(+)) [Terriglobus aquaticus]
MSTSAAPAVFHAINPVDGSSLPETFEISTAEDVHRLASRAQVAHLTLAATRGVDRARLLRAIADGLASNGEAIVSRAHLETGLPLARLQGELLRTTGQLRLFAEVAEEGSWVDARIDEALPDRKPLPRPDIRSMLRPVGPIAVFGASNFPLAFSVAGGDTASALAAGNPVVVKAHPAHPGTSRLVADAIHAAVAACGLPEGTFGIVYDQGTTAGEALVLHPAIRSVAFTGSTAGGQALMRLAASRPEPIPCFAEMGSTNPVFVLPGALRERGAALATGLQTSFTLGSGQFCTKPGLVFVPQDGSDAFLHQLQEGVNGLGSHGMLTPGIAERYAASVEARRGSGAAKWLAGQPAGPSGPGASATAAVFATSLPAFLGDPSLQEEIFGPSTLLIHYGALDDLLAAAASLHGHLTATLHGTDDDLAAAGPLVHLLETRVGRILFNGFPTGVEVCHSMVHGGPFPATSDSRFTSVGTRAMLRFARPVCYQDFPEASLPEALQSGNPLGILRMRNGVVGRA